jgi:CBS domain containing-hemolysin-like protein
MRRPTAIAEAMENKGEPAPPAAESPVDAPVRTVGSRPEGPLGNVIRSMLRNLGWLRNGDTTARDTLDTLIERGDEADTSLDDDERMLVGNILRLRDRSAADVMVPRADIVGIESQASLSEVVDLMIQSGHSRLPVYRETLDDAIGMVHIKDVLVWRSSDEGFQLASIIRPVLFVAPSMEVLQLLLDMRAKRSHMALVVDEFGGVDGLLTIEDVVEEIVGEIADEHDREVVPTVVRRADGSIDADARAPLELLDEHFGPLVSDEDREDIDTLGGLVVSLAGRVPGRGEMLTHPSGLEFEILDADPRRIKRILMRRRTAEAAAGGGGEAGAA